MRNKYYDYLVKNNLILMYEILPSSKVRDG